MHRISNCTHAEVKKAARALKDGNLVAFPTETVYGLGADATNAKAVSRIYSVKGRPTDHPLIVHISSIKLMNRWAVDIPDYAINLAKEFWPGPMTLILRRSNLAKNFITGGQETVGVRVPNQTTALNLLREFESYGGQGVAAPSANKFGAVSPTDAESVVEELGEHFAKNDLVLDGGSSLIGIESTIVDCSSSIPKILRPGAITTEIIEKTTGLSLQLMGDKNFVRAPGVLNVHYSPRAKIVLNSSPQPGDGFLALDSISTPPESIRISTPSTDVDFARDLYTSFRMADKMGIKRINIVLPSQGILVDAITDRVNKAAACE